MQERNRKVYEQFFQRFNYQMAVTTDTDELFKRAGEELQEVLECAFVGFAVKSEGDLLYGGTEGVPTMTHATFSLFDHYLHESGRDLTTTTSRSAPKDVVEALRSFDSGAILPLRSSERDELLGVIVLGGLRRPRLSRREKDIVVSSSYQLGIVFHNALAMQQLSYQKETLREEVEAATKKLRVSNDRLRALDASKDEFISMASHQLRTPLTSIKGYLSMVLEGDAGELNEDQAKLLTEAFVSSERMVQLIGDFLNLSRLQSGTFSLEPTEVNVAKLVKEEVDALQGVAQAKQQSIEYTESGENTLLQIDDAKIRQVIMNFIDNAMYYSPDESVIMVAVHTDDACVTVRVKDTGMGVPKEDQGQLFTKFYRAKNARRQRPDGTGVGIYMAKNIIDLHKGEIIFESTEGKGSTFGFRLPIAALSE